MADSLSQVNRGKMRSAPSVLRYILITPARNEAKYIRNTIDAVVIQTQRPIRWLIVSDGSTDGTDDIIREYQRSYDWIDMLRMPEHRDRSFAAKAQCFNAGFERLKDLDFDIIGSLDADISFDSGYFEFLISQFRIDPRLGVAGTPFVEHGNQYDFRFSNIEHVSGACQLFRRKCFEEIGGYIPIRTGGVDWAAVTTARMRGWQTRTFIEKTSTHHRFMLTGARTRLGGIFRLGQKDYYLGGHPLWQLFRSSYQVTRPPYFIGGILLFSGYMWAFLRRAKKPVSPELVRFHRAEQLDRLKKFLGIPGKGPTP